MTEKDRPSLEEVLSALPEWRRLPSGPKALFVELCLLALAEGHNTVIVSVRHAVKTMSPGGKDTATLWFSTLVEAGLIQRVQQHPSTGRGAASQWRIPSLPPVFEATIKPRTRERLASVHGFNRAREDIAEASSSAATARRNSPWARVA